MSETQDRVARLSDIQNNSNDFRSPIKIVNGSLKNSASATGSGKGKLFVCAQNGSTGATVTIDGLTTTLVSGTTYCGYVEFEFTKNFTVKACSNGSYLHAYCAVFY